MKINLYEIKMFEDFKNLFEILEITMKEYVECIFLNLDRRKNIFIFS